MTEFLRALIPVLVASIPVLILAFHLKQQNRIERKKVEVEHLRRVLEVLEVPIQTILHLQTRCDEIAARRTRGLQVDVAELFPALARDVLPDFMRHDNAVMVAMAFAREAGDDRLVVALDDLLASSNAIRGIAGSVLDTATSAGIQSGAPRVSPATPVLAASEKARLAAASSLVARIHRLYG